MGTDEKAQPVSGQRASGQNPHLESQGRSLLVSVSQGPVLCAQLAAASEAPDELRGALLSSPGLSMVIWTSLEVAFRLCVLTRVTRASPATP